MIRLITYATPAFRWRQWLLNRSARCAGAVDETSSWNRTRLLRAGFPQHAPDLSLTERGGGFFAWKPFIIAEELKSMRDGDWLWYCDVGKDYPAKRIDVAPDVFLKWASDHAQPCVPGVRIPWHGPMAKWTKRDAFVLLEQDVTASHNETPIQASFSLWQACDATRTFVGEWSRWCADRRVISDDADVCGRPALPEFVEHRHDQSVCTLLCLKRGWTGLDVGTPPPGDDKNPADIAVYLGGQRVRNLCGSALAVLGAVWSALERWPRAVWMSLRATRRQ